MPIRDNQKMESVSGKWDIKSEEDVKDSIGKPIHLQFRSTSIVTLFKKEIELPSVIGIYDAKLSSFEIKEDKQILYLEDVEDKKMYTSILRFTNDQQREKYLDKGFGFIIDYLMKAKTVHEVMGGEG